MKGANSAKTIDEHQLIKDVVQVDGLNHCVIAVQQNFVIGYRMVMLTNYTGELAPLTWKAHHAEIAACLRPRGYNGLMLKYHVYGQRLCKKGWQHIIMQSKHYADKHLCHTCLKK